MFKKLKKKIEEGGEEMGTGGLEKLAFAPMKLPGSVVRSSPASADGEGRPFPATSEGREELRASREGDAEGPARSDRRGDVHEEAREPDTPVGAEWARAAFVV